MIRSMTGFATQSGAQAPHAWSWELRAVNGKGLDLRLRVPDWIEGLEAGLRARLGAEIKRGNVTCNLRLSREEGGATLSVNEAQLEALLAALQLIERRAMEAGVDLAPARTSDLLSQRGLLEQSLPEDDGAALARVLLADFETVLTAFQEMRAGEGAALGRVLAAQIDEIERLTGEAEAQAEARAPQMRASLERNLARLLENSEGLEEARLAQELALIAVKADVTEELDRLRAHIAAARALLQEAEGPVGRKLDFLMQEFNREANTLCSKAQMKELTATGLALKVAIDQMREQVQNVE